MSDNHTRALVDALSAIDQKASAPEMALLRAKARGLIAGYNVRWANHQYTTSAVEDVVTANLHNPQTGAGSRTFTLAGKIDVRGELNGRNILIDHKTTSDDIADPNATYWRQLIIEGQLSHYYLLEWLNGRKPDAAMWDVIRKPSISPRQLAKAERERIAFAKEWFGFPLGSQEIEESIATGRETMSLYEKRLAHDCITERPERYFQRRTIPRLDSEILEYAGELWDHSQDLIIARRTKRHPRNSGACMTYGTPCVFLGVCSGYDDFESDNWIRKPWVHSELPVLSEANGSEVLTNSRIRTWQTCRRKHLNSFELGVERIQPEDRESLVFGTLIHEALAAWWRCFIPQGGNHGNSNSVPASAVGVAG